MEITPIGIQNIGWKFWIVWTVTNFIFLPIIYFFYPETGMKSCAMYLSFGILLTQKQPIAAWKTSMLTIGQSHPLLSLGIEMQSAEGGHRSTLITKRKKLNEQLKVRELFSRCLLNIWNGRVIADERTRMRALRRLAISFILFGEISTNICVGYTIRHSISLYSEVIGYYQEYEHIITSGSHLKKFHQQPPRLYPRTRPPEARDHASS